MPHLQPAGLFARLISSLFPKRLEVQVRTEELSDGRIAVKPVYLVGGQEVDPASVSLDSRQRIQGYAVVVDPSVLTARRRGAWKASKRKAAEYLEDLRQKGISVRRTGGSKVSDVREVRPQITLTLNADDTLDVQSQLADEQGNVVARPADLGQLRRDDGWYVAGGDLVHVSTTDTEWDEFLLTDEATRRLTDVAVPEFLKALDTFADKLGRIEKNDPIRGLSVLGQQHQNR